jgi:hypothetical protein
MKRLEFYKPQKSGNGACITFQCTTKETEQKKNGFYVNILKQSGWNNETKSGAFKENVNNPEKHKKIKLTENEISNILYVIESNGAKKFSTVHVNGTNSTPIFFEPYLKENTFIGHLFKIGGISIALNMAESISLREYCKISLANLFNSNLE